MATETSKDAPETTVLNKTSTLYSIIQRYENVDDTDDQYRKLIKAKLSTDNKDTIVVVLDDDPTGTQTVYNIPVLTSWSTDVLENEIVTHGSKAFYILTNSRSFTPSEAEEVNRIIATRLVDIANKAGLKLSLISRSDSTLRGHYPLEIDVLASVLEEKGEGGKVDGHIVMPFFLEGGRYTLNDIHYVAEGDDLVPAAMTPFAKDKAFGFTRSNLKDYVEEKTKGRHLAKDVISITLDDLRKSEKDGGGPSAVRAKIRSLSNGAVAIVNALSLRDVEVLVLGLLDAESIDGKKILVRSAASYVQARLGLEKRHILDASAINNGCEVDKSKQTAAKRGGLVVVGSYVPKSTKQLSALLDFGKQGRINLEPIEINVNDLLASSENDQMKVILNDVCTKVEKALSSGVHAVVYTSRTLVTGDTPEKSLQIGNTVSSLLVEIVKSLQSAPRFIIAKGGITSSDVATKGLGVQRAIVLGQASQAVPAWKIGDESKFPGMSYVVFPGNVGAEDDLAKLVERLSKE